MAASALTREEGWGLAISIAGHGALLAVLLLRPAADNVVTPPERVEVSISEVVGLTSTSPNPAAQAAPDEAPELGEAAPAVESAEEPLPPEPTLRVIERPVSRPVTRPAPRPSPVRTSRPPRPNAIDAAARSSRSSSPAPNRVTTPPRRSGGSRFAEAFSQGTPGASSSSSTGAPAATISSRVRSSLSAAISRELKPHWVPPQGADAEKLVTYLAWNLNEDGSLAGTPRVVRQAGISDANQAQAARHAEQAVRAVQLAAPFDLPPQYYAGWKRVSSFEFDIRLSQ